jgi:putative two-component system response regulator
MDMLETRKKVVLVDDNPINLKLARNTLMGKYDVFTVSSAAKLFELLEEIIVDIILLDVMMPEMSGYDAIKVLKNNPRTASIPVIFLTAKSDTNSELEGFAQGAVDFVSKPFVPQLLLKRIDVHLLVESQKKNLGQLNQNLINLVEEKTKEIQELQGAIIKTMSNLVEYRDDVTGGHIERSEQFLKLLTEEMINRNVYLDEVKDWDMKQFFQSSQLHDVGKIGIRDNILMKPGRLTAEEFNEMKKHTFFGERVIERIQERTRESAFLTHAKIMAGTHHEKWDGTGYPRGLAGHKIPLQGRLLAIVDVYDALISERSYKKPFPPDEALGIIKEGSGVHFDPVLVEIFIATARHF